MAGLFVIARGASKRLSFGDGIGEDGPVMSATSSRGAGRMIATGEAPKIAAPVRDLLRQRAIGEALR